MAILKITQFPSNELRIRGKPVGKVTKEIKTLIDDMFETMYAANGIGLAAVQVGVDLRIAVIDVPEPKEALKSEFVQWGKYALINPEITESEGEIEWEEGCLSVPDFWTVMKRKSRLKLKYMDPNGEEKTLYAGGLLAVAIQQEIDHLDGKLIIDAVSRLKQDLYTQKRSKETRKQASKE